MDSKLAPNLQLSKNLSTGVWLSSSNRIKLTKVKGKFIQSMGYATEYENSKQKFDFLYPEEAIYLVENLNLQIFHQVKNETDQIPLSVQQCYELFFQNQDLNLNDYKIYKSLVRYGYIVRRIEKKTNEFNSEKEAVIFDPNEGPVIKRQEHGLMTKSEIFRKLNQIVTDISIDDLKRPENLNKKEHKFRCLFEVYQPSKTFKKSKPTTKPTFKLITRINNENLNNLEMPDLNDLINLDDNDDVCKLFAFINDSNDVMFYTLNQNLKLPFIA